jgi:putative membrane protein
MRRDVPPVEREVPLLRILSGGALMGVANLVPGISGGTMLLASGVYPPFIEAVAQASSLRFTRGGLRVLAVVAGAAAIAILLLAGVVKGWVVDHRWVMYSLFIGLTVGGVPVLRREMRGVTAATWCGGALGLGAMAVLTWMQWNGQVQGAAHHARSERGLPSPGVGRLCAGPFRY